MLAWPQDFDREITRRRVVRGAKPKEREREREIEGERERERKEGREREREREGIYVAGL